MLVILRPEKRKRKERKQDLNPYCFLCLSARHKDRHKAHSGFKWLMSSLSKNTFPSFLMKSTFSQITSIPVIQKYISYYTFLRVREILRWQVALAALCIIESYNWYFSAVFWSKRKSILVPCVFNTTSTHQSPILTNKSALMLWAFWDKFYLAKHQYYLFSSNLLFLPFPLFTAHYTGFSSHSSNKMCIKNILSKR